MRIRPYLPGDEETQARIYNMAAGVLPAFKPANAEEIARRYRRLPPAPGSILYAIEADEIVGYAVLNDNGRVSFPWCLAMAEAARGPLLDAILAEARRRGLAEVWAAYRADWASVHAFLEARGFVPVREMINYAADLATLPKAPVPEGLAVELLRSEDVPRLVELGQGIFAGETVGDLEDFFWNNPYLDPQSLFALRTTADGTLRGAAAAVVREGYADPTKVDPAMPCFRLGAFGTELERHKRINGLFSCVFDEPDAAEVLLAEAGRRLERAGLAHVAAQAPSDQARTVAFLDRFFRRQGAFPILARRLED